MLRQKEHLTGQESLFGAVEEARPAEPVLPNVPAWTEAERLKEEKAVLGFYISGHPLERYHELVDLLSLECNEFCTKSAPYTHSEAISDHLCDFALRSLMFVPKLQISPQA